MTHPPLTHRQAEVLLARCETGSRKAAAEKLGMSARGVGWWLEQAFRSCGCRDDAQACFAHRDELAALSQLPI